MNLKKQLTLLCSLLGASLLSLSHSQAPLLKFDSKHTLKLAFGSCNKFYETDNSTIFNAITDYKPDLYAWLGDAAYVEDMVVYYVYFKFPGIEKARERLENTKNDPAYKRLRESVPIVGVWDNHDFGAEGGDKSFPFKYEMRDAFLDFVDEPKDSARRTREGIYESYTTIVGDVRVNLVLLDVRFNKDPKAKDILGEGQWKWLEKEFQKGDDLYFVSSGSQVIPEDRILHDNWYTESTTRLVKLIRDYNVSAVILSGDVHLAELIPYPCSESVLGYQLYELTSSGLTHTSRDHFKQGELFDKLFFPETYNRGEDRFVDWNFGTIEIEPNQDQKSKTKIRLHVRDVNGSVVIQKDLTLGDLQRKVEPTVDMDTFKQAICLNDVSKQTRFLKHLGKAFLTKEILLWLAVPVVGIGLICALTLYGLVNFCYPRKSKLKTE